MPRPAKTDPRIARARRDRALARGELRTGTEQRVASASPTGFAVKVEDPTIRAMVDKFLADRGAQS